MTPEQRVAQLEANYQAVVDELRDRQGRDNRLHEEIERLRQQAAGGGGGGRDGGPREAGLVNTLILGKPDFFQGEEGKWNDLKVIFKAYVGVVNGEITRGMAVAEGPDVARR